MSIINLVDFDQIKPENCAVSLIFTHQMAIDEIKKIDACANILKKSKFQVEKFDSDFSTFLKSTDYVNQPPDLILCLANEKNIWSTIQHNLPPLVLHATTNKSWGINLGRHIPKTDWCIMCRFGDEVINEFVPPCSTGEISIPDEPQILGALPFLSPASAIIMLAEMAKLTLNDKPQNYNFVDFSMKRSDSQGRFIKLFNPPKSNCICDEQKPEHYLEKIKKTKFWKLNDLSLLFK